MKQGSQPLNNVLSTDRVTAKNWWFKKIKNNISMNNYQTTLELLILILVEMRKQEEKNLNNIKNNKYIV